MPIRLHIQLKVSEMYNIDVRTIFFDIDGTLVSFDTHKIPQTTIEAINTLKQQNIKIIIATGRPFHDINSLGDLELDGYITVNGALCLTKDKETLFSNLIGKEDLQRLSAYLKGEKFSLHICNR